MPSPSQIDRLEGLAGHMLDSYLALRERSAVLEPLLFDQSVIDCYGSGRRHRGFHALRTSLFMSCVQDIAKLVSDKDQKAPSFRNFIAELTSDSLVIQLRSRYAKRVTPLANEETDPEILTALKQLDAQAEEERRIEFDQHLHTLRKWWDANETGKVVQACRVIRDKVTAHTEIKFVIDKYVTVDVAALDLKWSDVKRFSKEMQEPVASIGLLIRCAGFAWEMLDRQLAIATKEFWRTEEANA